MFNNIREKRINKIKENIVTFCKLTCDQIDKNEMRMGNGLFNRRCHLNAIQQVKEGKMEEVYSCICLEKDADPIIHFINKDKDGFFVDNTLGWGYELCDYYIIKKVNEDQYNNTYKMLTELKKYYFDTFIRKFNQKLLCRILNIKYDNIGI